VIKFKRLLLTGLLCFATLANSIPARQSDKTDPIERASANIAGAILVNGHSMDYLRALTDQFGGRLTGTPAYRRSAEWAANQFREAGIKNVKLEPSRKAASYRIPWVGAFDSAGRREGRGDHCRRTRCGQTESSGRQVERASCDSRSLIHIC